MTLMRAGRALRAHRGRGDPRVLPALTVASEGEVVPPSASGGAQPCRVRLAANTAPDRCGPNVRRLRRVYVAVAVLWSALVENRAPTRRDLIGSAVAVAGMAIIVLGHRGSP